MARIMIVDDDEDFGELTKQRLSSAGFEVIFHLGAFGSLNALRKSFCDLVVLDVNMPGLSGTQLIQLIRETEGLSKTKVLLCSSMDVEALRKHARDVGAHGYLSKGVGKIELVIKVKQLLADVK